MSNGGAGANGNLTARKALAEALACSHAITASWAATGASLRVSGGLAYRIALQGYEPKTPEIRDRLGLPPNTEAHPRILRDGRPCACGCGNWLIPAVWNQVRIPGHPRRRFSPK